MIASNDYLRSVTAEWGYGKTEAPSGAESLPRKRGGTGDYKGAALIVIFPLTEASFSFTSQEKKFIYQKKEIKKEEEVVLGKPHYCLVTEQLL
jgi:hypothetical protein